MSTYRGLSDITDRTVYLWVSPPPHLHEFDYSLSTLPSLDSPITPDKPSRNPRYYVTVSRSGHCPITPLQMSEEATGRHARIYRPDGTFNRWVGVWDFTSRKSFHKKAMNDAYEDAKIQEGEELILGVHEIGLLLQEISEGLVEVRYGRIKYPGSGDAYVTRYFIRRNIPGTRVTPSDIESLLSEQAENNPHNNTQPALLVSPTNGVIKNDHSKPNGALHNGIHSLNGNHTNNHNGVPTNGHVTPNSHNNGQGSQTLCQMSLTEGTSQPSLVIRQQLLEPHTPPTLEIEEDRLLWEARNTYRGHQIHWLTYFTLFIFRNYYSRRENDNLENCFPTIDETELDFIAQSIEAGEREYYRTNPSERTDLVEIARIAFENWKKGRSFRNLTLFSKRAIHKRLKLGDTQEQVDEMTARVTALLPEIWDQALHPEEILELLGKL